MRIGRLNVEITGDSKKLEEAAQRSSDSLKRVKEDIGTANDLSFSQLKSDVGSATAGVKDLSRSLSTMTVRALNKEFDSTQTKLSELQAEIAQYQRLVNTAGSSEFSQAAQKQVDKLTVSANELQQRLNQIAAAIDKTNNAKLTQVTSSIDEAKYAVQSFGTQFAKSMRKANARIRRFIISLVGLRTTWALLTRATRDYLARDKELNTQVNSMIAALGQAVAPLIKLAIDGLQFVVRWLIVAVAYFTTFINALFGMNLAVHKNIKAMKKFGSEAASAKSQLAGFDEINNIQTDAGGISAETLDFTPFDMTEQLKGLEAFKQLIIDNKDEILLFLAAIAGIIAAIQVMNAVTSLVNLVAMFSNPIGLALILIGLIAYIILNWDDVKAWWETNGPGLLNWMKELIKFAGLVGIAFSLWILGFSLVGVAIGVIIAIFVFFGDQIVDIIEWVRIKINDFVKNMQDKFKGGMFEILSAILQNFKNIFNGIIDILKGIVMFVQGVFTGNWKKAWDGIKLIFKGVWDTFTGIAKTPINIILGFINSMINGINAVIRGMNNIRFDAPWWVPGIGGKSFGINIPTMGNIPYLANGGVTTGPTLAMTGEGRYNEAVIPLGQSPQFANMKQDIADAVAEAMGSNAGGQSYKIDMYLDDVVVGSVLIDNINRTGKMTGKTILV